MQTNGLLYLLPTPTQTNQPIAHLQGQHPILLILLFIVGCRQLHFIRTIFYCRCCKAQNQFAFSTRAVRAAGCVPGDHHRGVHISRWAVLTLVDAVVSDLAVSHTENAHLFQMALPLTAFLVCVLPRCHRVTPSSSTGTSWDPRQWTNTSRARATMPACAMGMRTSWHGSTAASLPSWLRFRART